ncbi:MAG: 6-carboxytetrahydropterin synthase [Bacteroidetes bacterium]|nr:6-carboxytetrahydropterin synthase [Bacteroidota bacterium]
MKNNSVVRITKRFGFEAAHVLHGYDGLCKNIHGHSYILFVTLKGVVSDKLGDPKLGMLMDFSNLKQIVKDNIVDVFDHSLMLMNESAPIHKQLGICDESRVIVLPFQPTCENLIVYFAEILSQKLPKGITLHSLKLNETESSYAEWFYEDNQ